MMSLRASKQRPQVRVDLGHEVAGEEAEPLAGLDRRPHQHDLLHLPAAQQAHRPADREVRLAGAGRADADHHVVAAHRLDVAPLAIGARPQAAAGFHHGDVRRRGSPPPRTTSITVRTSSAVSLPCLRSTCRSCWKARSACSAASARSLDLEQVAAGDELHPERVADRPQVLVPRPEEDDRLVAAVEGQVPGHGRIGHV